MTQDDQAIHPEEITPIGGYILLLNQKQKQTAGGIHLPDSVQERLAADDVRIVAVGPDCKKAKVGQRIMVHGETQLSVFKWGEETYAVCHEDDVICHLPERNPEGRLLERLEPQIVS